MLSLRLHPNDNVVVATVDIAPQVLIPEESMATQAAIPAMHKIATRAIARGQAIIKYQQTIGFASQDIEAGDHVHLHNCEMGEFERDYQFCKGAKDRPPLPDDQRQSFMGYRRPSGKVGTRNYIAVLTTVNCSATAARRISEAFQYSERLKDYPNVDGVVAYTHSGGCCIGVGEQDEGYQNLKRTLTGYATHPNFAAVLIIGLGCEAMQMAAIVDQAGLDAERIHTLSIQSSGGTRQAVAAGIDKIDALLDQANRCVRTPTPASELLVALECGGSDAYSGITANPALGAAVDRLVAQGGGAILSETPEIYGAEHLLTRRAASPEVGKRLIERIHWWEDYTARNGGSMNNNPTPGNKAGGLTTILEKSLGAQAKAGSTNLTGVYKYAEAIDQTGLVFMDSPGFDPASITGMVASGATLVCFTTGRGSAYGCKPSPCLKLATNSQLYQHMEEDMDIDCGSIVAGESTVQDKGLEIFERILTLASGEQSKSEVLGYGDNEFTPWQIGAQM